MLDRPPHEDDLAEVRRGEAGDEVTRALHVQRVRQQPLVDALTDVRQRAVRDDAHGARYFAATSQASGRR